ncbi:MAG: 50S ribosomal protein L25/general stress protein Ctc [Actinomycetales bacterium]|nr:50S ribosomal protein L25/general stress protein Ctc [Actinomycetales bacterium]
MSKLVATARTEFGKGAARRTRRAGLVPAVLYGHGADPVHVALPGHATFMALKVTNVLLEIELDGDVQLAIAKDVQRDPIRDSIEHVDLQVVRKGEKVIVDVPVHVVGESAPGTIHLTDLQQLSLEAEATNLPEAVEVSVEGLEAGTNIFAADVALPEGSTLAGDPEALVVSISVPQVAESADEAEEGAAEAAPAEAADAEAAEG